MRGQRPGSRAHSLPAVLIHGLLQPRFAPICQVRRAEKRLRAPSTLSSCFLNRRFLQSSCLVARGRYLHSAMNRGSIARRSAFSVQRTEKRSLSWSRSAGSRDRYIGWGPSGMLQRVSIARRTLGNSTSSARQKGQSNPPFIRRPSIGDRSSRAGGSAREDGCLPLGRAMCASCVASDSSSRPAVERSVDGDPRRTARAGLIFRDGRGCKSSEMG